MIRNDLHHYKYSTATFLILAMAILSIQIHFSYLSFLPVFSIVDSQIIFLHQ